MTGAVRTAGAVQRADPSASEDDRSMSTKNATQNQADASEEDRFTPVSGVERVDDALLKRMTTPDKLTDDGVRMFAAASRTGVLRTPGDTHEFEAVCVLYLSADGRRAVERYYSGGIESAPRACIVPEQTLFEAQPDGSPHPLTEEIATHPEVSA